MASASYSNTHNTWTKAEPLESSLVKYTRAALAATGAIAGGGVQDNGHQYRSQAAIGDASGRGAYISQASSGVMAAAAAAAAAAGQSHKVGGNGRGGAGSSSGAYKGFAGGNMAGSNSAAAAAAESMQQVSRSLVVQAEAATQKLRARLAAAGAAQGGVGEAVGPVVGPQEYIQAFGMRRALARTPPGHS